MGKGTMDGVWEVINTLNDTRMLGVQHGVTRDVSSGG